MIFLPRVLFEGPPDADVMRGERRREMRRVQRGQYRLDTPIRR